MALTKVTYTDGAAVIYAQNLNDIQDAIIALEQGGGGGGGAVDSVNGKTGVVVLTASDVGAYVKPSGGIPKTDLASAVQTSLGKADTALQAAPVTSVNGQTGAVSLSIPATAGDVGAIAAPASPSSGDFLVYNGSAWAAQSLSVWQGGSF